MVFTGKDELKCNASFMTIVAKRIKHSGSIIKGLYREEYVDLSCFLNDKSVTTTSVTVLKSVNDVQFLQGSLYRLLMFPITKT